MVCHGRMKQISMGHPADLTKTLGSLVRDALLRSDEVGRGMVYFLPWGQRMPATLFDLTDGTPEVLGSDGKPQEHGVKPPESTAKPPDVMETADRHLLCAGRESERTTAWRISTICRRRRCCSRRSSVTSKPHSKRSETWRPGCRDPRFKPSPKCGVARFDAFALRSHATRHPLSSSA